MGFHTCEYCSEGVHSSGDVTLAFINGHVWEMPDMILHYVADHGYRPPSEFQGDVLGVLPAAASRGQTKGAGARRVGYLSGPQDSWDDGPPLAGAFFMRLWSLMQRAARQGDRQQTRGIAGR